MRRWQQLFAVDKKKLSEKTYDRRIANSVRSRPNNVRCVGRGLS